MIVINRPKVEKLRDKARLSSQISIDDTENYTIWFEVEQKYSKYLVEEKADAFLVAVLPFAMMAQKDIRIVGVPVSEMLYWNLTHEYIPALCKYSEIYNNISINTDITNEKYNACGVGTGFSAGVDSFYTVLRNLEQRTNSYNLTHLTFFNVGACGYGTDHGGDAAQLVFKERVEQFKPVVDSLGLELVAVNSNLNDFKPVNYNWIHSFRSTSAVLALQKLFSNYYYSSGAPLTYFTLDHHDSANYDILSTRCFSTETTSIFSVGLWESRMEKVQFISNYPVTFDVLNVCNDSEMNCCVCDKCIRTMGELYSIGKLEKYKTSFDVEKWNTNLTKYIARVISKKYDGTVESKFNQEIIDTAKKNGVLIPRLSYIVAIPGIVRSFAISIVRKNKYFQKKYHEKLARERGLFYADVNK